MSDPTDDRDINELAQEVIAELDAGSVIGNKVILSQRQAAAILAGSATLAGVLGVGVGDATAQTSAKLGSDTEPIDADLGNYGSASVSGGYEITIDGDTYQINE